MAAIAPTPTGTASCIYLPRLRTVRTASAKLNVARSHMGGIFSQTVAGDKVGLEALFVQNAIGRDGRRQDCGLRDLGQAELIFRALEAKLREFVAKSSVGFFECLPGEGIFFCQLFAHADGLRALAGEKECHVRMLSYRGCSYALTGLDLRQTLSRSQD